MENAELRDPKVGFNSRADRFPEKIVEQDEPDQTVGNEVNKIFEQLPTFKAKAQKDKPKDKLVHPRVKNVILGTKVSPFDPRSPDLSPSPRKITQDQQPTTTSDILTGTSHPSIATTTRVKMFTSSGRLIINLMSRSRLLIRAIDLSVMVLLTACVAAMLQEIVSTVSADSEMTAVLTEANFEQYKAKEDGMLVEFFVSWCGHCKRFTSEFSEAAALAKSQKLKIVFGLLNAEDYPSLAARFKVESFPSVRLFKGDTVLAYEGPRNAASIVSWTVSKMNFHPEIVTIEEFNEIKDTENLVLAFFGPEDREFEQFKEFGRTLDGVRLLHVNYKKPGNRIIPKIWNPSSRFSIVLFRNQGHRIATFTDKTLSAETLTRFFDSNRYPLIGTLNSADAIERVFYKPGLSLLFFVENTKDPFVSKFIQLAKDSGQNANFFLIKRDDQYAPEVREFLGTNNQSQRQVWAIQVGNDGVESYNLSKTITARHIHRFLIRLQYGRLTASSLNTTTQGVVIDLNSEDGRRRASNHSKVMVVFNYKASLCSKRPTCVAKMRRFRGFAEELYYQPTVEFCLLDFDRSFRLSKGKFYRQFRSEMPVLTLSGGQMKKSVIVQDFDWRYRTLERLLSQAFEGNI